MKRRNIALCVVLSIVTFGIYGIYWFVQLNNNVNELANPPKKTSGGVAFLLTLVTCGIYGLFWAYKMGSLLDEASVSGGKPAQNRAVIYLVLQILGLGIVAWCLMQSGINALIPEENKAE